MPGYYVLNKSSASQPYHFVLKADNHETILSSESYATKAGALNGIESCQQNSPADKNYEKRNSTASQPYFVLKASNGLVIGTSQMYGSTSARDTGIESVKVNGPSKVVKDNTGT